MKPFHRDSDVFPEMGDQEFKEFADDVEAQGLLEPITLLNGAVLDGRHRERACQERGITPRYVEWDSACGLTPLEWVISKNLHRRQLSVSQKAALAVEYEARLAESARQRMAEAGRSASPGKPAEKGNTNSCELLDQRSRSSAGLAGRAFAIHSNTVLALKAVRKVDEAVFKRVKAGEFGVEAARREVGLGPSYGRKTAKSDRLVDVIRPLRRYLKNWTSDRLGVMSPREAARILEQVQEIDRALFEVERALEERSVTSRALT